MIVFISPFSEAGASTKRMLRLAESFEDRRLILPGRDKYGVSSRRGWFYFPLGRKSFLMLPVWWLRCAAVLLRWRPSVVVFQKPHLFTLPPALFYRLLTGRPVVFDCDEWDPATLEDNEEPGWKVFLTGFLAGVGFRVSSLIVYGNRLVLEEKIPESFRGKAFYVPNGVDTGVFKPDAVKHDGFRVMYVGMLFKIRHMLPLVEAAGILRKDISNLVCVVVGGGDRLDELKKIVAEKGLAGCFYFAGMVEHDSLPGLLNTADVLVAPFTDLPGIRYQSNVKVFEYMASGRPLVASRVGELDRVLDGGGLGFLVPPGDSRALAEAVLEVYRNPEAAARKAVKARAKAESSYDWRVLGGRFKEVVGKLK